MESFATRMPTGASIFSAYASFCATFTLVQQAFYQFVPPAVRQYVYMLFKQWFTTTEKPPPQDDLFTLIIQERDGMNHNEIFDACQIYLCNRMNDSTDVLKVCRAPNDESMNFKLAKGVAFSETFEGIDLIWSFQLPSSSFDQAPNPSDPHEANPQTTSRQIKHNQGTEKLSYFSLSFNKEHRKKVSNSYLHFVIEASKDIQRGEKVLRLSDCKDVYGGHISWHGQSRNSVKMTHPFTFEKLAMNPEMKKLIMDDLDRFVKRKEFYRRVGKPWKQGYLLYGPPGTGKSSLVAAMANHLKFDIYDLQLASMYSSSALKDLLVSLPSQSIIVIEDIDRTNSTTNQSQIKTKDCVHYSCDDFEEDDGPKKELAPLLNFVDGLWSCCGDERLIVFTTNHKEKLDPALLRPGRMDMHIHMSYLTMPGFKILAYNYLLVSDHRLFGDIENLLSTTNATPAEVAEELMRSEDVDTALQGVVELLEGKQNLRAGDAANLTIPVETEKQNI